MLLSVKPVTDIRPIILPDILSKPVFLILPELSFILGPVYVFVIPIAMHLSTAELAAIMASFFLQVENTDTVLLVVLPMTKVATPINPMILARALLLPSHILPFKLRFVGPFFTAQSMLLVVEPIATELAIIFSVEVTSLTVAHVVTPVATVLVTVRVGERTWPMRRVITPLPVILSTISPLHGSIPVTETTQPLA